MNIEQIYTSCLAQAAYYIESNGEVAIIDPIRDYQVYIDKAKSKNHSIKYIFETHFHADFISGHIDLAAETGAIIVYGDKAETGFDSYKAKDYEVFKLGKITITAILTPGHTPESTCYLLKDENQKEHSIFTGDTLFIGDVGRPDLLDSNPEWNTNKLAGMLYDSLIHKIMKLNDDILIYPAHGAGSACGKNISNETYSTLGDQKLNNYALKTNSKEEFISLVTEGITPPPDYFFKDAMLNKMGYESLNQVKQNGLRALDVSDFENKIKDGALVIDSRDPLVFEMGFIPKSINIGLNGQYAIWAATLFELDRKIIIVAENGEEEESVIRLSRVGFDNIQGFLKGGMDQWINAGKNIDMLISIDTEELGLEIKHGKNISVVDVRKETEFKNGHVKNADFISLNTLSHQIDHFDNEKEYYIYCGGGYRSVIAASILKSHGINQIKNIYGGFGAIKSDQSIPLEQ